MPEDSQVPDPKGGPPRPAEDPREPGGEPATVTDPGDAPVEEAVEKLLDQVGIETQPRSMLSVGDLRGRTAIVTGASSGIGRAIALEMGRCGLNVAFNFLDDGSSEAREDAHKVARELRQLEVRVLCRACDVREPERVKAFVQEVLDEFGQVTILVNNAGIARDAALWKLSDEAWTDVMATNLDGAFYFIRAIAPHFREQEYGKIVNVASVHGMRSVFGISNYATSKSALMGLTRSAAVELGPSNVNVNAVAPGYIRTTRLTNGVPAEILDQAREESVLGRLGDPQDVASVVLFLCSEGARHITGAVIPIDGGYLL